MIEELDEVEVITLFVEDLTSAAAFYTDVLGLGVVYRDEVSVVVELGRLVINLLRSDQAPELVEPSRVAGREAGVRVLFTMKVADADRVCAQLEQRGVRLLNGPVDRPWGRRSAAFADPAGNVWEVAQVLEVP